MSVISEIQNIGYNARDPRMDGYNQFHQKQKLYQILWETQRQLNLCSHFVGEDEWLEEQAQDQMLTKLSR